ncbi:MAG: DUF4190 domain-containing protein [Deltaproteobacteria bacterium]|nr:MAG: DUF4190 domain-containing protein [Deltaproteobacteria bacterium]
MEAARTLKANLKLEGKPCGWCQAPLALGDDAAVCTACDGPHHRSCWDSKAGCSTEGCSSAPLRRLDVPAVPAPAPASPFPAPVSPFPAGFAAGAPMRAPAPPPPGMMTCPRCMMPLTIGTPICPNCRAITSPDGLYHGPRLNAPGSVAALVLGIVGVVFFCLGVVLGPLAIWQSNAAKAAISRDPAYGGGGMATAGLVLGIISLLIGLLWMVGFLSGLSNGLGH